MTTRWTFHAGIDTIGGTIIEMNCDNHRLIFDMGRSFNPARPVFDAILQARDIKDLQRLGSAPCLPGVFIDGSEPPRGTRTMVAVSHSHLDHIGLLPYLRHDIPVLVQEDTYRLIQCLDAVGDGPQQPLQYLPVGYRVCQTFGPFTITVAAVDHDTPGASAFLIETPDLKAVYSGDLRLHGANPELTLAFADAARSFGADVLWIEGTRCDDDTNDHIIPERQLGERLQEFLTDASTGVYFTYYPRHPERLSTFLAAARAAGRRPVLQAKHAFIYAEMVGQVPDCLVFQPEPSQRTPALSEWLAQFPRESVIDASHITGKESELIIDLPYNQLIQWVDIDPAPGALYIHSNGSPLGTFDPAWQNFVYWLDRFGITLSVLSSTGHGSRADIVRLAEHIAPSVLMPVHSLKPHKIGSTMLRRLMPRYGVSYTKADLDAAITPSLVDLE